MGWFHTVPAGGHDEGDHGCRGPSERESSALVAISTSVDGINVWAEELWGLAMPTGIFCFVEAAPAE